MTLTHLFNFLEIHQPVFLTLHILSTALGLGGATISDVLFLKFLKDYRISKKEKEVLFVLKTIILSALILLILTGLTLYLPNRVELNHSAPFLMKAVGVLVLTINGVALHIFVAPYLTHLNLESHHKMGRNWHKLAFALGGISLVSWYSVFLIAMLKSLINWSFFTLFLIYLAALFVAIFLSHIIEGLLSHKAKTLLKNKGRS